MTGASPTSRLGRGRTYASIVTLSSVRSANEPAVAAGEAPKGHGAVGIELEASARRALGSSNQNEWSGVFPWPGHCCTSVDVEVIGKCVRPMPGIGLGRWRMPVSKADP